MPLDDPTAPAAPAKIFTSVYDLQTSPFAFDFITFLAMSQAYRVEHGCDGLHIVIVPGKGTGFECADFKKYHEHQFPIEHAQWRFMNVFMPALGLLPDLHGLTVCVSRDHGRQILKDVKGPIFPVDYDIENPPEVYWTDFEAAMLANLGYEFPGFRAPKEALGFIDRWIDQHAGGRKVVSMTLREGLHGEVKNSNTEAWVEFARSLDPDIYYPVFIPDMVRSFDGPRPDLGGFPVFTDPTSNIMLRMALYERSYISMFTSCGPISTCFYNGAVRYLIFKTSPPYHKGSHPWAVVMGLDPANNDMRIATPYQKRFEQDESFDLLSREFHAMAARIEANPEDAFRRHTLKRTDIGPALVSEVSQYLSLDIISFHAVEFCFRFMERHPEYTDQIVNTLALADLATTHSNEATWERSRKFYGDWLKDKDPNAPENMLVTWANVKIGATLGNQAQFGELIKLIPLIDQKFNRTGVLKAGLVQIAVIYFKQGYLDEALQIARMVNEIYPSPEMDLFIAMILEGTGRLAEAHEAFLGLIKRGMETPGIYESLSRICRAGGDMRQSIDYMHRSMELRKAS